MMSSTNFFSFRFRSLVQLFLVPCPSRCDCHVMSRFCHLTAVQDDLSSFYLSIQPRSLSEGHGWFFLLLLLLAVISHQSWDNSDLMLTVNYSLYPDQVLDYPAPDPDTRNRFLTMDHIFFSPLAIPAQILTHETALMTISSFLDN